MNDFLPSAKKYRPINFSQVIGQNSIINTLKKAADTKQINHAYLFAGPRGSGKTTCARIFAKTINCLNIIDGEACNQCTNCLNFMKGQSFNIIELDAASNNSVQDIRNIIDKSQYKPESGQYKIYIIDEAHMLSSQALNAFLKILEEPPKHVVFILATTERQKIILTIVSRCQVFNFSRLTPNEIIKQLQIIAKKENILIDDDALNVIAKKADGALRDALMIFDQISLALNKKVSYKDVVEKLNIIDDRYFQSIFDSIINEDINCLIATYNQIIDQGLNPEDVIIGVINYLRTMLLYCNNIQPGFNLPNNSINRHIKSISESTIIDSLALSNTALSSFTKSKNVSLHTELYLINLYSLYKKIPPIPSISNNDIYKVKNADTKQINNSGTNNNNNIITNDSADIKSEFIQETITQTSHINPKIEPTPVTYNETILEKLRHEFQDPRISAILKNLTLNIENDNIDIVFKNKTISKEIILQIENYIKQNFSFKTVNIDSEKLKTKTQENKPIIYTEEAKIEYFKEKYSNRKDNLTKFISELKLTPIKIQ